MPLFSLTGDGRGESALALVPPSGERDEVLIAAGELTAVDTYTGVALRGGVEYYARYRQQPVTFCPPHDGGVWDMLSNLMGHELPAHFTLSEDALPAARHMRDAVLPARRFESIAVARQVAEHMPEIVGEAYRMQNAIFLSTAFSVLVENAVTHGSNSPIGAVAAIGYDRDEDALRSS